MKIEFFKIEMRDPYCGGWVQMEVRIERDGDKEPVVTLINTEGYVGHAEKIEKPQMFHR